MDGVSGETRDLGKAADRESGRDGCLEDFVELGFGEVSKGLRIEDVEVVIEKPVELFLDNQIRVVVFIIRFERYGTFGQRFVDYGFELVEADSFGDGISRADGHRALSGGEEFNPTAPRVVLCAFGNTACNRVLVDVADECQEVIHVVDRLAFESVLKEVAYALITFIEIGCIGDGNALDNASDGFCLVTYEQVYMVGHQTVGVDVASWWKGSTQLVFGVDLLVEGLDEFQIVVSIDEDVLTIDAAEHYVINASKACFPGFACHSVSI